MAKIFARGVEQGKGSEMIGVDFGFVVFEDGKAYSVSPRGGKEIELNDGVYGF